MDSIVDGTAGGGRIKGVTPPALRSGAFNNTHASLQIKVPAGSVTAYKAASGWSKYASREE